MVDFTSKLPENLAHHSAWQRGADDARAGKPVTQNPFPEWEYHFVTWINGWAVARHRMAKENEEI